MQAFSGIAIQRDRLVSKDVVDELVHGGFTEYASLAGNALERSGAFHLLRQKVVDICGSAQLTDPKLKLRGLTDTAVLAAEEATRYTGTFNLLASIARPIGVCQQRQLISPVKVQGKLTKALLALP